MPADKSGFQKLLDPETIKKLDEIIKGYDFQKILDAGPKSYFKEFKSFDDPLRFSNKRGEDGTDLDAFNPVQKGDKVDFVPQTPNDLELIDEWRVQYGVGPYLVEGTSTWEYSDFPGGVPLETKQMVKIRPTNPNEEPQFFAPKWFKIVEKGTAPHVLHEFYSRSSRVPFVGDEAAPGVRRMTCSTNFTPEHCERYACLTGIHVTCVVVRPYFGYMFLSDAALTDAEVTQYIKGEAHEVRRFQPATKS